MALSMDPVEYQIGNVLALAAGTVQIFSLLAPFVADLGYRHIEKLSLGESGRAIDRSISYCGLVMLMNGGRPQIEFTPLSVLADQRCPAMRLVSNGNGPAVPYGGQTEKAGPRGVRDDRPSVGATSGAIKLPLVVFPAS